MESESATNKSELRETVGESACDDQQQVNRQFDEVCLNETAPDVISELDPGSNNVQVVEKDPGSNNVQSLENQSLETSLSVPVNGATVTTARSMSSASDSSQEIMYSIGNTPLSSPVKVPKSLSEEEKLLLVEMEQQNQVLDSVKAVEEKYQKRIEEEIELRRKEEELRRKEEELRGRLEDQVKELEERVEKQREEFAATISDVKSRLGSKLDQMTKSAETSRKDLESMVIKYATSESQIITAKKAKESAEYKLQQQVKETESLNQRIRGLTSDKNNLTAALDRRILEVSSLHREMDKLNHDLKEKEGKIITLDHKLKCEEESGKEMKEQNDNLNNLIKLLREEIESKRTVTEHGASVEDLRDENGSLRDENGSLRDENGSLRDENGSLRDENGSLRDEIDSIKQEMEEMMREKIRLEGVIRENELKLDSFIEENEELKEKLKERESRLHRELESKSVLLNEMDEMKRVSMIQSKEVDVLRQKEAELMEFSEAEKRKTTNLEVEIGELMNRVKWLEEENNSTSRQVSKLKEEKNEVESELDRVRVEHEAEIGCLREELKKKGSVNERLKSQVDELINDQRVMIKKHHNIVRELNKELGCLRKRVDLYESHSSPFTSTLAQKTVGDSFIGQKTVGDSFIGQKTVGDSFSNYSRTSSSSSLTDYNNSTHTHLTQPSLSISSTPALVPSSSPALVPSSSPALVPSSSHSSSGETNSDHTLELSSKQDVVDLLAKLDKEKLVERIIKLQRHLTKRNEKVDFLEDHNHQLVQELKKKTRLVQHYLMREESGALTTSVMDSNKKELARKGSTIMTSLYKSSSNSIDSDMTLELSLEINRKLQSVLEDTILKNIALKESIQTLGDEIARLSANGGQSVSK